jgi:uncharacterized iron-regulated membrane protein
VVFSTPKNAAVGLSIVALGLPAYYVWRTRRTSRATQLIPPDNLPQL